MSFDYTNNRKYTIVDAEMKFVQKSDVTGEQPSVFDYLKEWGTWTDEKIADIYILGFNRKCTEPGETISNKFPMIDAIVIAVISDDEDLFAFNAYGVTGEMFT